MADGYKFVLLKDVVDGARGAPQVQFACRLIRIGDVCELQGTALGSAEARPASIEADLSLVDLDRASSVLLDGPGLHVHVLGEVVFRPRAALNRDTGMVAEHGGSLTGGGSEHSSSSSAAVPCVRVHVLRRTAAPGEGEAALERAVVDARSALAGQLAARPSLLGGKGTGERA